MGDGDDSNRLHLIFYILCDDIEDNFTAFEMHVDPTLSLRVVIEYALDDFLRRPFSYSMFGDNLSEPLTPETGMETVMPGSRFFPHQTNVAIVDRVITFSPYFLLVLQRPQTTGG